MSSTRQSTSSGMRSTAQRSAGRRSTVRARLALTYALMVTLAGVVLMAIVAVFFGLVPNYSFEAATLTVPSESLGPTAGTPTEQAPTDLVIMTDPSLLVPSELAVTIASRGDMLQLLLFVSGAAVLVLAALGAWVGWIVAGRMLRPLQEVNAAARRAADGHLDHRVALEGPRDEITDLADTFDDMLGEIEQAVDAHRRFAANASHELRTPLATTRVMLDVALAADQGADREFLERLRETNERSIGTVESLLDLAEIEAVTVARETIDLARIVREVVAECGAEAESAGVRIEMMLGDATVCGDPNLLRQLVTNLVQNAIRHNLPGGEAWVTTGTRNDRAQLTVENTGDQVDAAEVARLVDPFQRGLGRTSTAATRGRGLGLSIVNAIVVREHGELVVEPRRDGGLSVTVLLPYDE